MQLANTNMQPTDHPSFDIDDRRRTLRLRRSALLDLRMEDIDRPSIKIAETLDEYQQAFGLIHDAYASLKYIRPSKDFPYYYSLYSLLPETCVFIFKSGIKVISTLTQIHDTQEHGLPMDKLYKNEIDTLRSAGRIVVELSSFVTSKEYRMRNIMICLCKIMFNYSKLNNVDDICMMVNPKHVSFYKRIFLFSKLGPKKFYENVGAPAVALRVDLNSIDERLRVKYSRYEFTEDLHAFFCRTNTSKADLISEKVCSQKCRTPDDVLRYFSARLHNLS